MEVSIINGGYPYLSSISIPGIFPLPSSHWRSPMESPIESYSRRTKVPIRLGINRGVHVRTPRRKCRTNSVCFCFFFWCFGTKKFTRLKWEFYGTKKFTGGF